MAKVYTIPGQLPGHFKEISYVLIGSSQVKLTFGRFAFTFSNYHFIGFDQVVTTRIHHFLDFDDQFREQIEKLIMDEPVSFELDEVMTYSSFVTFLSFQFER